MTEEMNNEILDRIFKRLKFRKRKYQVSNEVRGYVEKSMHMIVDGWSYYVLNTK